MKISVDRNTCIGSGLCVAIAPEIFDLDDDGLVTLKVESNQPLPEELHGLYERVIEAEQSCPVGAIFVDSDE